MKALDKDLKNEKRLESMRRSYQHEAKKTKSTQSQKVVDKFFWSVKENKGINTKRFGLGK